MLGVEENATEGAEDKRGRESAEEAGERGLVFLVLPSEKLTDGGGAAASVGDGEEEVTTTAGVGAAVLEDDEALDKGKEEGEGAVVVEDAAALGRPPAMTLGSVGAATDGIRVVSLRMPGNPKANRGDGADGKEGTVTVGIGSGKEGTARAGAALGNGTVGAGVEVGGAGGGAVAMRFFISSSCFLSKNSAALSACRIESSTEGAAGAWVRGAHLLKHVLQMLKEQPCAQLCARLSVEAPHQVQATERALTLRGWM